MSDFSRSPLSPRGEPEPRLRDSGAEQDGSVTEPPHPPATEVTARDGHQGPPGTEQDDPAGEAEISLPSKGEVATPFDLVGYGYQRNGQRLGALRKSTIDGLSKAESPSPGELEQVRRMSRRDAGRLAVPVQVLHAVLQQDIRGKAEHDVLRLLGAAIRSHPIFDDDAVRGVLELAPDAGLSRAIERICGLDDDVINASAPDVELTPKSIVELRTNAVYTLISS